MKTYVLAKCYEDFRRLCCRMQLDPHKADYLSDVGDLMGKRVQFALATERWYENPAYDWRFLDRLKVCCALIFIEGEIP